VVAATGILDKLGTLATKEIAIEIREIKKL
jgi:hypothetical protein